MDSFILEPRGSSLHAYASRRALTTYIEITRKYSSDKAELQRCDELEQIVDKASRDACALLQAQLREQIP